MSYEVTAPLVIIANDDGKGGDWYGYDGAVVPEGLNDERCKQLVKEGMLQKVRASSSKSSGPSPDSVPGILASVGDDKAKAQAALDKENAQDTPRSTLVEPLEAIVKG